MIQMLSHPSAGEATGDQFAHVLSIIIKCCNAQHQILLGHVSILLQLSGH